MKKLFLGLTFLALLIFAVPATVKAETPCATFILTCPNGSQHTVIICDMGNVWDWPDILCGCDN